ncbi:MAG: 16S rRNA (uracil(1498)-N(3))-methyltransferase [Nitrospirae bacterium]|nr:16S rRNA (uracil(1498)-N(3))-methyltransferase [Nitrospirota bacterium]
MHRIYLPASPLLNNRISITAEKAHYLRSVLRCRKGDSLTIFDGTGKCFKTTIVKADRREIITEVIEKFSCNLESHLNITLVQSLLKGEKMDMVVQKTTELGVKEIVPVITERSQLRETKKLVRWRKIAEEASRQSGRSVVPVIHEVAEFKNIFSTQAYENYTPLSTFTKGGSKGGGFIFYEEEGMRLSDAVKIIKQSYNPPAPLFSKPPLPPFSKGGQGGLYISIGPEGGFTKQEVAFAKDKGLLITSLGRRILMAETAAIAAVTLVQFLLGDLS